MSFKITCYTLFDVTHTGVLNRNRPGVDQAYETWLKARNTQCNFDTLLQAISLRSQPEVISYPKKIEIIFEEFEKFGFLFLQESSDSIPCWVFDFEVQHVSVFDDGKAELGSLYNDCDGVPMILVGSEWKKLPTFLDSSIELRNIYFEVMNDE